MIDLFNPNLSKVFLAASADARDKAPAYRPGALGTTHISCSKRCERRARRAAPLLSSRDEPVCRSSSQEPSTQVLAEDLVFSRTQLHVRDRIAWPIDERV